MLTSCSYVERLVRPLEVVALDEAIELRLLLQEVLGRTLRDLLLRRQVHALVPTVLLRMAQLNAFDADAEPRRIVSGSP